MDLKLCSYLVLSRHNGLPKFQRGLLLLYARTVHFKISSELLEHPLYACAIFYSMTKQNFTSTILILVNFSVLCQNLVDISMNSAVECLSCMLTDFLNYAKKTQICLSNETIYY